MKLRWHYFTGALCTLTFDSNVRLSNIALFAPKIAIIGPTLLPVHLRPFILLLPRGRVVTFPDTLNIARVLLMRAQVHEG